MPYGEPKRLGEKIQRFSLRTPSTWTVLSPFKILYTSYLSVMIFKIFGGLADIYDASGLGIFVAL